VKVEISIGELVDRVTILSIKWERIRDEAKLVNIRYEYGQLTKAMESIGITERDREFLELRRVNERLWEIEDRIRDKEHKMEFDEEFIQLARSVYLENDTRAAIKRRINIQRGSPIIEEKSYTDYGKHDG
jgi:hypothetical protein